MPYKLSDNGLCVMRADTGENIKCHATNEEAQAHMAALMANVVKASVVSVGEGVYYGVLLKPGVVDEQGDLVTDVAIEKACRRLNARDDVTIDVDHETEHVEKASFNGAFVVPDDMSIAGEQFGKGWLVVKYRAPAALVGDEGHSLEARATGRVVKASDGDEKRLLEDIEITGFAIVKRAKPAVAGPTVAAADATPEEIAKVEDMPMDHLALACKALHDEAAQCGDHDTAAKCSEMAAKIHKMQAEKVAPMKPSFVSAADGKCEHCGAAMVDGKCPECDRMKAASCAHKDLAKKFYKVKGRRPVVEHIHKAAMPMPQESEYDLEETADGLAFVYWTRPGEYADLKEYDIEDVDGASLLMATVGDELSAVGYRFKREKWTPEAIGEYLAGHVTTESEPVAERQVAAAGAVERFVERMSAGAGVSSGYEIKSADGVEWVEGIATVVESGPRRDNPDVEITTGAVAEFIESGRLKGAALMMDHSDEAKDKMLPYGPALQKVGQLLGDPWAKWGTGAKGEPVLKAQSIVAIFDSETILRHKRAKAAKADPPYEFSHDSNVSGKKYPKVGGGIRKVVERFDTTYNIALVNRGAHHGCTWEGRQAAAYGAAETERQEVAMDQEKALREQALRLAEITGKLQAFSERDMASVRAFIAEAPVDKLGKVGEPPVEYVYTEMHGIRLKNSATVPVPAPAPATTIGVVPGTFVDVREKASAMVCDFFAPAESSKKLHLSSMDELVKRYMTSVAPEFKSERTQAGLKYAVLSAAGYHLEEYHKRSDVYADDYVEDVTERRKAAYAAAEEKLHRDAGKFDSERQKAAVLTTGIDQSAADALGKVPHPGYEQTEVDDDGMFSIPLDELCDYEAVPDFQTKKIINTTEFELPLVVTEGNSYQEMQAMSDYQETYSVALYGGIVTVSEQAEANAASIKIIELIPDKMYRAAQRRRRRLVTEVMRANSATAGGAGNVLFSAGNGNANANAYTFDQFIALLVSYCTIRAYGHGVNNQDIEHLHNKPTWALASVARLFDLLRDLSLDTNPASTNRSANQAVMAFGNIKFYAANDWDTAASTARIVIGGAKKLFRLGDYKGIKTPQIYINNDQRSGVSFSAPVKQFAVKWGGGVGIQDPRFAAAFTG